MVFEPNSSVAAARAPARVALVTCSRFSDLDSDDQLLIQPLAELGVIAEPAVWDDPAVDWAAYRLAVLRSPWDYTPRRAEFLSWARSVPRLANPAELITWNTDKRYLAELAARGVATVETSWVAPGDAWTPGERGEIVIKPTVGAGSFGAGRYDLAIPEHRRLAAEHVARFGAAGRPLMIQPYLSGVDTEGETALIFIAGRYSHAIRKGAMLTGPQRDVPGLYLAEQISTRQPDPAQLLVAARVLGIVSADYGQPLYARVDLLPGADGAPVLVELELTEPSLFLSTEPGAASAFAAAIALGL